MGGKIYHSIVALGIPLTVAILLAGRSREAAWTQDAAKVLAVVWMPFLTIAIVLAVLKVGETPNAPLWGFVAIGVAAAVAVIIIATLDPVPALSAWLVVAAVLVGYYAYGLRWFMTRRKARPPKPREARGA